MDKELLEALSQMLDEKLDNKLDEKLNPIKKELNEINKKLVYFILNLCAKFSLKSQPSIYGKYGKWIL